MDYYEGKTLSSSRRQVWRCVLPRRRVETRGTLRDGVASCEEAEANTFPVCNKGLAVRKAGNARRISRGNTRM
jgi:hypothetical protein